MRTGNIPSRWLLLGALSGLALAGVDVVEPRTGGEIEDGSIARVNGVPIPVDRYRALEQGLEGARGGPIDPDERTRIVARLVEEELLVQRGVELGLLRRNGPVRNVLVRAVMEAVVSEQAGAEPAEGELEAYYREHRSFFASAQRLRVQRIVFDGERAEDAEARAARAFAALGNELTFETARVELGDEDPYPPPDALLPATTLGAYIGPVLLETAMALSEGEHSQPVAYGGAFYVVKVLERDPGVAPALPRIRERVLGEWRRMRQEAALREYIDWLRARAEVRVQRERA